MNLNFIMVGILLLMFLVLFSWPSLKKKKEKNVNVSDELDPVLLGTNHLKLLKQTNSSPRVQMFMSHMGQVKIEKEDTL